MRRGQRRSLMMSSYIRHSSTLWRASTGLWRRKDSTINTLHRFTRWNIGVSRTGFIWLPFGWTATSFGLWGKFWHIFNPFVILRIFCFCQFTLLRSFPQFGALLVLVRVFIVVERFVYI